MGSDQKKGDKDMKPYRMGINTTEHYSSFEEAAKAWGCKPVTKNEDKMKKLQEKFLAKPKFKCNACGEQMNYLGNSIMTCTNDKCKGVKIEREDSEGNKSVSYVTSYFLLDDNDASYANYIFN